MPDTVASRTIAVLLVGLILVHAISILAYQVGVDSEVDVTNELRLAERLVSIKRALTQLPAAEREQTAHSLSGGPLEVHWSTVPLAIDRGHHAERTENLRRRLLASAPELEASGLAIGLPSPLDGKAAEPHLLLVSMRLADGSWTNFSIARLGGSHGMLGNFVVSTTVMALGVLLLSILILRSVTRPLHQLATAARQLYVDGEPARVDVSGPQEIRALAAAFNELQQRVKRLIDDRTLTLAAISHDLKSPLTRAKLRIEEIENDDLRNQLHGDLAEMLEMVESALAFLKGDETGEPLQDFDLRTVLESICDDLTDLGHQVRLHPASSIVIQGRHLALKRALSNLVANAAKYARTVSIAAAFRDGSAEVLIDDDGPGIPLELREAVFQPFYRMEASRNRATGGTGLGLTVARTIIRGHGGDVALSDSPAGGLRVRVRLPLMARLSPERTHRPVARSH